MNRNAQSYRRWEHELRNMQWVSYMLAELALEQARRGRAVLAVQMAAWVGRRDEWVIRTARRPERRSSWRAPLWT